MITVITRFAVPAGLGINQMQAAITQAAPIFKNVPGLIRKQFLLSADGRTSGGVYLWEDEALARKQYNWRYFVSLAGQLEADMDAFAAHYDGDAPACFEYESSYWP